MKCNMSLRKTIAIFAVMFQSLFHMSLVSASYVMAYLGQSLSCVG